MASLVVVFSLAFASVVGESVPITRSYHEEIGIPEAKRIRLAEESMDFDGGRIIGGQVSTLGQHPHLGGLLIRLLDGRESVCGSSLLSATKLVTAAHCWRHRNVQGRQITVVLGSVRLFSGGIRQVTSSVTMHAGYREDYLHNDIAIISIVRIVFNNAVNPIRIPDGNNNYAGVWATAAGFGVTGAGGSIAIGQVLSHVNLQVITNQVCTQIYGGSIVLDSTLCTATPNGQSTCGGDSGGSLAIGTGSQRELIGITSFHHRDGCASGNPAGFGRVTSFSSWIRAHL